VIGYSLRKGDENRNEKLELKTSDSRVVKINLGTLGESEQEEELSIAAMRQFWQD